MKYIRQRTICSLAYILMINLALCGCARKKKAHSRDENPRTHPSIDVHWDPSTGRGTISMTTAAQFEMALRIQDRFDGYSGGLYPGSMNQPAFTLFRPGLDTKPVAIWCAQDESIWDHARQVEFSPGWSENFGHGPDGRHLRYRGGRINDSSPSSVLLASKNSALPYEVSKWMAIQLDGQQDGAMVIRTRIRNISKTPVVFDFWSGDDPWVGNYGTSRGDVGWHNGRWVKNEQKIDMATSQCAGIADLQAGKWKTANYMCLNPDTPPPTAAYFANRFAHSDGDISPGTALNAKTMTAFNVGWQNISLKPNETFELMYAMGPVLNQDVKDDETVPIPPEISQPHWRLVRSAKDIKIDTEAQTVRFISERVEMHLLPEDVGVRIVGAYKFVNETDKKQFRHIYFPFAIDDRHPYPHRINVKEVKNLRFQRFRRGILFPLKLGPKQTHTVHISYDQKSADKSATYIVTSARTWNSPLDESVLTVEAPDCDLKLSISYPMKRQQRSSGCHYETTLRPFWPEKEFTVRWD